MPTTRYFDEQVLRKRPYLSEVMCRAALANPIAQETQPDGRTRVWGMVNDPRDHSARALRVVVLEDGTTIRNAFLRSQF